jgi:rhodanese-related sulfurtransferase
VGFTEDHLLPPVNEGLGNSAYLVDLGDGRALAVDASRDVRLLREASRVAHPRRRVVLLGPAGCGAHHHHRRPEGDQHAARDAGRGHLRPAPAGQPGLLPRVLRPAGTGEPAWTGPATRRCGPGAATSGDGAQRAGAGRAAGRRPPVTEFAAGHIPGAVSIPLRDAFAPWLGWVLPPDVPLVFVLGPGQDPAEVVWQAAKIGYDHLADRLAGGMDAWRSDGGSVRTVELVTAVTDRFLEKGP